MKQSRCGFKKRFHDTTTAGFVPRVSPDNPFHPLDGRIVKLGLHHTVADELGFDVELGIWWRAAPDHVVGGVPKSIPRSIDEASVHSREKLEASPPVARTVEGVRAESQGGSTASVVVFRNDEAGYVRWVREHPGGYVVNTTPRFSRNYLKLHRASCIHVSRLQPGYSQWTTGQYIKVCSDSRRALDDWSRSQAGGALQAGCYCCG